MITAEELQLIMPNANADLFIDSLNDTMKEFGIDQNQLREAAFLANVAHESAELTIMRENLNYSAEALLKIFPTHFSESEVNHYARNPQAIANRVYAKRFGNGDEASGDGWKFRGAGPFQITFHDNFASCGDYMDLALRTYPELLEIPSNAMRSAGWYCHTRKLNEVADADDFRGVCAIVNTGNRSSPITKINGWASRLMYRERAMKILGG